MHPLVVFALIPVVPLAAAVVGFVIAVLLGRPAECWRIVLPLFLAFSSVEIVLISWPPTIGFDLQGGSVLVYEVEPFDDGDPYDSPPAVDELIGVLQRRIDPGGVRNVVVRRSAEREIEILVPGTRPDVEQDVRQLVSRRGLLEFRIIADPYRDARLCTLADQSTDLTEHKVLDESGKLRGRWVSAVRPMDSEAPGDRLSAAVFDEPELASMHARTRDGGGVEVLVVEDAFQLSGNHIASVAPSLDSRMTPCLNFRMTPRGAVLFGALTGANLPDPDWGTWAKLGIILDGELLSAPRINDRITEHGQISGKFTEAEVDFLVAVLRVGALPMNLDPVPVRVTRVSRDRLVKWTTRGALATLIALLLIGLGGIVRYRARGLVAALAAAIVVSMVLAGVMMFHLPLTFPVVAAACGWMLFSALALVIACRPVANRSVTGPVSDAAAPPVFIYRTWPILGMFCLVLIIGAAAYVFGVGTIRGVGTVLTLGALSGTAILLLCCWPLLSMPPRKEAPVTGSDDYCEGA